jgi:hypothetical protein
LPRAPLDGNEARDAEPGFRAVTGHRRPRRPSGAVPAPREQPRHPIQRDFSDWCEAEASSRRLHLSSRGDEPGDLCRCRKFGGSSNPGGALAAGTPCAAPAAASACGFQSSRPALTCIIGARLAWIVPMISSISIPCRYTDVVETYECPSCRWITGSGTPSRASSTA